jgi:L-glyceraldehyde 3-phosphate reductase
MFNRWIEAELLHTLDKQGVGCIPFSVLAQGLLTDKYLAGIPKNARINRPGGESLHPDHLSKQNLERVHALNAIAKKRNQTLAQMAVAWVLRDSRVTSALIGASTPQQIRDNVAALENLEFTPAELSAIDEYAREGHLNLWEKPSTDQRV